MRAAAPAAAARAFVAAGRPPTDPANIARRPFIKICGVTDAEGTVAAVAAGADAIGLNVVPGTPRELEPRDTRRLAMLARSIARPGASPFIVAITADADDALVDRVITEAHPDAIQLSGTEPPERVAALVAAGHRVWKVLHIASDGSPADAPAIVERARAFLDAGAERLLLDTAGGVHPGGTGRRVAADLAAAVARQVPVILAGGLGPSNVAEALRAIPAIGVDVASGVELPRVAGSPPRKDRFAVALFAKRAAEARLDRPAVAVRPTPVHPGILEADDRGRWGIDRAFGGRYVPETLMAALEQLERAYADLRHDPRFWAELRELLAHYAGRPTPLYRADRLAAETLEAARALPAAPATPPDRLRLYLKREDLAHTGAHKINNALGQALLTRRLGKTRVIAETGAGQHGVATATACALLDLPCVVYMGAEDIERQQPNVLRMGALGTEVRAVTSGSATLKDAINEAMRDWVTNVETTHYVLGSAMGPHPYPTLVRDLQRTIGDEAAAQVERAEGRLPDLVLACVGGGSNAIGLLARFIGEPGRSAGRVRGGGRRRRDRTARGGARRRLAGDPARGALADAPGSRRPGARGALGIGRPRLPRRGAADQRAPRRRPAGAGGRH